MAKTALRVTEGSVMTKNIRWVLVGFLAGLVVLGVCVVFVRGRGEKRRVVRVELRFYNERPSAKRKVRRWRWNGLEAQPVFDALNYDTSHYFFDPVADSMGNEQLELCVVKPDGTKSSYGLMLSKRQVRTDEGHNYNLSVSSVAFFRHIIEETAPLP